MRRCRNFRRSPSPASDSKAIAQVGTVSANGDEEVGQLIADAMAKVGKEGVITVEEGSGLLDEVQVVEGMQFDRGYLSPYFINKPENMTAELEDAWILVIDRKLSAVRELLPLLETVAQSGGPLLVIAEEVEGEALATLVVNTLRGILKCVAVKAPGFGDRRKAMLADIAIVSGATLIAEEIGITLEKATLEHLGKARKVIVDKEHTTIVGGTGREDGYPGTPPAPPQTARGSHIDYDREKLQERIAKLAGGVAVLKVGAATETTMKEKKGARRGRHARHPRSGGRRRRAGWGCRPGAGAAGAARVWTQGI